MVLMYDLVYFCVDDVGGDFGFVVFDEVYYFGGEGYWDILWFFVVFVCFGLMVMFEWLDGVYECVEEFVGLWVYCFDVDDLVGDYFVDYEVCCIEVELMVDECEMYD